MNNITEAEVIEMIKDTNDIIKKEKISLFGSILQSAKQTDNLTNEVEFWKWMQSNHKTWSNKQLQGKVYEWDFMSKQRSMFENILYKFDAGNCSNKPGTDVDKIGIFDNLVKKRYQNKAYTSKSNPDLSHTPKDAIVITNKEKVAFAKKQGFETGEFMDAKEIKKATNRRDASFKSGNANTAYSFKSVSATMTKAGVMGCIVGMSTETIASYRKMKNGIISQREYISEIVKAGGDAGVTGGVTSGIMIPVSATITSMGMSSLFTIPITYVVGAGVNKVVAPCFARGKYKEILNEAKYYQNLEFGYKDLINSIENSAKEYENYIFSMNNQMKISKQFDERYKVLKKVKEEMNKNLKDLYDSI